MRIISFSWTTKALLQGKKTVTRRRWQKCPIKPEDLIQAYDRSPRVRGKCVAIIKILNTRQEPLNCVTDAEEVLEGGLWGSGKAFIQSWMDTYPDDTPDSMVWRIEFKIIKKISE